MPRRIAPRLYGKARPEGPSLRGTVFMLRPAGPKIEARRAEAKFFVVNLLGNGSEPDSGSPHVIMPKGVSQGTNTSRCRPLTVSVISRHTGEYYCLVKCLYCA